VGALGGFVDILVVDPLEAVAGDVVAQFLESAVTSSCFCSAVATPNTVSGRPRFSNSRSKRHTPAREPYS